MSALKQYIDFFSENKEIVCAHSSSSFNDARNDALNYLTSISSDKSSLFEEFCRLIDYDFGININNVKSPALKFDEIKRTIPALSANLIQIVNDTYYFNKENFEQGFEIFQLEEPNPIKYQQNPVNAFNDLFVSNGIKIKISSKLSTPIQMGGVLRASADIAVFRKIIVDVEKNASAQLIFNDLSSDNEHKYLVSQNVYLNLAENASLSLIDVDTTSSLTNRLSQIDSNIKSDSSLSMTLLSLGKNNGLNNIKVSLDGANAKTSVNGVVLASGNQRIVNYTNVIHTNTGGVSRQNFKYVLDDNANCAFDGKILVNKSGKNTDANQSNKNLLLSKTARMHSEPQLIIYNDDVKCGHGSSTGQLDANALFYMRQRGIPENIARTMLTQAFLDDIIGTIPSELLRERIKTLVEYQLYSRTARPCDNCKMACDSLKINQNA